MRARQQSNRSVRLVVLILIAVLVAWNFYQRGKAKVETGRLEYRMLTGEKDGVFQVIMLETADRFTVMDSAYRDIFMDNQEEIVTRVEQMQLFENYDKLQFRVGFNLTDHNEQATYRVSRELFNQFDFRPESSFEIHGKRQDSLITVQVD